MKIKSLQQQDFLIERFRTSWEDWCTIRDVYESRCKKRIQRQLEIGKNSNSNYQCTYRCNNQSYFTLKIAGYKMDDDEIEDAVVSGVTIFSKEVLYIIFPLLYVTHDSLISLQHKISLANARQQN